MAFLTGECGSLSSSLSVIAFTLIQSRELEDGDILNIDITVYLDGFHGDTSDTFLVGNVASDIHLLL